MPNDKRKPFDPWLIPPEPPPSPPQQRVSAPQTVSEITAAIKDAITRSLPATVHVIGQISNLKRHTSGHLYFTLKDPHSELPCVMWRTDAAKIKFIATDGLEVIATGTIEVFDRAGRYQLYVRRLEPRGVGSLELAFRQLYDKLEKEGLFDPRRKKRIPRFPRRIAIMTSPTGAAIADMLRTIHNRYPCVSVVVFPVKVQGDGAATEIANAIQVVNTHAQELGGFDVIIVGRGGGSLEDLWAFNEESVARAIFGSKIPIISGVGHEVDTSICDLVADARAATPTAAAQMAVPVLAEVLQDLLRHQARLRRGIDVRSENANLHAKAILKRSPFRDPLSPLRHRAQTTDLLGHRLHRSHANNLATMVGRVDRVERLIQRIAPVAVIATLSNRLSKLDRTIHDALQKKLVSRARTLEFITRKLDRLSPLGVVQNKHHWLVLMQSQLVVGQDRRLAEQLSRLKSAAGLLQAVSHQRVLERGYSITRKTNGQLIRSTAETLPGDEIITLLRDGNLHSSVTKTETRQ